MSLVLSRELKEELLYEYELHPSVSAFILDIKNKSYESVKNVAEAYSRRWDMVHDEGYAMEDIEIVRTLDLEGEL